MASKNVTNLLIIVVVGAGLVTGVLYYQPVTNYINNFNKAPATPPTSFFSNSTAISLANQTERPPLIQPSTTLLGGYQYASMHYAMNVSYYNGSYQYSNIRFIGTAWNFTGSSLSNPTNIPIQNSTQTNYNTSFNIVPSFSSYYFANGNNSAGNIVPVVSSSLTTGDVSGQGSDSFIASYSIKLQNKTDSELVILNWDNNTQTFKPWDNISLGLYYPAVMAINFRGYDTQQILVAGFSSMSASYITTKMINFSPDGNPVNNTSKLSITTNVLNNIHVSPQNLVIEKGDVYGFGQQQFLLYGLAQDGKYFASLYGYNLTTNAISYLSTLEDFNLGRPLLTSYLHNSIDQLVVPCLSFCPTGIYNPTYSYIQAGFIYGFNTFNNTLVKVACFPYAGIVGAGTIDGNDVNELILLQNGPSNDLSLFRFSQNYYMLNVTNNQYTALPVDLNQQAPRQYTVPSTDAIQTSMSIFTVDLTFDAIPEILIPDLASQSGGARFYLMRKDTLINGNPLSQNLLDTRYTPSTGGIAGHGNFTFYGSQIATAVGDLFGQALRLVHQDTYLTPSNPTILAVMASPPTVDGISQDPTNALTSYGTSTSQTTSSEASTSLGFNMELGLGVKTEVSYGIGVEALGLEVGFMGKVGFGMTFSNSYENTKTVDISQTWGVDGQHNGVVFASLLVKHWNYTVVNGPLNGDNLTFSFPEAVTVQKFDTSTFDQVFPGYSIDTGTFGTIQKIGHPETYPSKAQADATKSPFLYESQQKGVSQGTGYDTVTIDASTEQGHTIGHEFDASAGFSFEMATEGFQMSLDFQANANFGQSFTITQGNGTQYYGQITDINSYSDWQHYQYSYGLYAYLLNRPDLNASYQVINYWTVPLGPSFGSGAYYNIQPINAFYSNLMVPNIPVKALDISFKLKFLPI